MNQTELKGKVHFYCCALLALRFAEKYQAVSSPTAKIVFLMRWLSNSSNKRLFPRETEPEIAWLQKKIRAGGPFMNVEQLLLNVYEQARCLSGTTAYD